jgi:2-oxoglutarate dehydrogenase E2 component (dihydrolipoamide succinyltransferase)
MAKIELIMPQMGEGIIEATILKWVKNVGDKVKYDETVVEIATDKVDSEIPSPVEGVIAAVNFKENDVVSVGKVIALIETGDGDNDTIVVAEPEKKEEKKAVLAEPETKEIQKPVEKVVSPIVKTDGEKRFYSPLVRSIAKKEGISEAELSAIIGSGQQGRIIKRDIEAYLEGKQGKTVPSIEEKVSQAVLSQPQPDLQRQVQTSGGGNVEIIEMDRMRKLIADYMVESKRIAPHVTSMVEADLTNVFNWRNKNKDAFFKKYNQKLTFTPIFIQAIVRAIKDFPLINVSVDGTKIIVKKDINIGMATALPTGNLIVPVIKNADLLSLAGIAAKVNDLAARARNNALRPDDIQGGTYTLTNLGSFGNVIGTPIINQPEVAIMATGAIKKKPAVLETENGDVIAIRQMMYLSHAYDHRVVDGNLGGSFVRRVADYLENFDHHQSI